MRPSSALRSARRALALLLVTLAACGDHGVAADDRDGPGRPSAPPGPLGDRIAWSTELINGGRSSPRVVDVTGDGVLDIIVGSGEETKRGGVSLIDGSSGELVWKREYTDEVYATACLLPVDGDDVPDIIIGSRKRGGDLHAMNARDAAFLWSLREMNVDTHISRTHFNSCIPCPDQDGDGQPDILSLQSGGKDRPGQPEKAKRLPGRLWIVGSTTGKILRSFDMPDDKESYAMPALQQRADGSWNLVVGTGGEIIPGHVISLDFPSMTERWRVPSATKGYIAGLLLHDFEGTGTRDVLATAFDGVLQRLDGATGEEVWRVERPGFEIYSTPGIGRFNDDDVLDVVLTMIEGTWPDYRRRAVILWVDGKTGAVIEERDWGVMASSTPDIVDLDGDGFDEVLITTNKSFGSMPANVVSLLAVFDGGPGKRELMSRQIAGWTAAQPWLGDLDGDGQLDIVHACSGSLMRLTLEQPATRIRWGEYRGAALDGVVPRDDEDGGGG